jgi:hypothetical protein
MPSTIIGAQSGGVSLVSGRFFSGAIWPIGGLQLIADRNNSGAVFVALSGNVTISSGGGLGSGGMLDGLPLYPGDSYFVPKFAISGNLATSGTAIVTVTVAAGVSGFCRLYWEGL